MNELNIKIPKQFEALFDPQYRHIVYYGGRGGAKSYNICLSLLLKAMERKCVILCVREIQNSIDDSVHELMQNIIDQHQFPDFKVTKKSILNTKTGSKIIFKGLKYETASSLKSIPDVDYVFVEEAQCISKRSIEILIPTIRKKGSQIIWAFNPDTPNDPVMTEIVNKADAKTFVCKINSEDVEEFLSDTVIAEREKMKREDYAQYLHVWMGEPRTQAQGSIYAERVGKAMEEGRINSHVAYNDGTPVFTAWDLGISDSTAIIFAQVVGNEIHLIDYYEDSGRALTDYIGKIKQLPYNYDTHFIPHDARIRECSSGKTREEFFRDMGVYNTTVLKADSVADGIDEVRNAMSRIWINSEKCERLIKCLKEYHYEWDEKNQILHKKPKHDWSSHACDAIRYLVTGLNSWQSGNQNTIKVHATKRSSINHIIG